MINKLLSAIFILMAFQGFSQIPVSSPPPPSAPDTIVETTKPDSQIIKPATPVNQNNNNQNNNNQNNYNQNNNNLNNTGNHPIIISQPQNHNNNSNKAPQPRKPKPPLFSPEFMEKVYYGCNIQLRYYALLSGTGGSVVYYDLSPFVGYKLTEFFSMGAQILYNNSILSYSNTKVSYDVIGPGAFARLSFLQRYYVQAEYDLLSVPQNYLGTAITSRSISNDKMFGIGYKGGGKLSYFAMFMFDYQPSPYSPYYSQPLIYRAGLVYNF